MGHVHLVVLPKSRNWRAVVDELTGGGTEADVISACATAAERDLARAATDPTFVEAVRLMLMVPTAARAVDFGDALRRLDLRVGQSPGLFDIVSAISARLDEVSKTSPQRTDLGAAAGKALASLLLDRISAALPSMFDASAAEVQAATRALSTRNGISDISRDFFGRLVAGNLNAWLARTLSTHIGPGQRFATVSERAGFDRALAQYASEATRIIQEFAPGWYGRRMQDGGMIASTDAAAFGAVAMKKIVSELRLKRGDDA